MPGRCDQLSLVGLECEDGCGLASPWLAADASHRGRRAARGAGVRRVARPLLFEPSSEHVDLTPFAVVLLAVASECLVLRRDHPWWVWASATGIGTFGVAVNEG